MHQFVFDTETKTDVEFVCSTCRIRLGFNKPGVGTPSAVRSGLSWVVPKDADYYTSPCTDPTPPPPRTVLEAAVDPILP